jgi:hypothetical protein
VTRWRGLTDLLQDAVHHGTAAVERVHQSVARTPWELMARVPPLAPAAREAAAWQARIIGATYGSIRAVNAVAGAVVGACLEAALRPPRSGATQADGG